MRGQGGGPRTAHGKAVVSRNAVKHGIGANVAIIDGIEDPDDWHSFRDGIMQSLDPEGVLETDLAEQIAFTRWKLRRIAFFQAASTRFRIDTTEHELKIIQAGQGPFANPDIQEVPAGLVRAVEVLRVLPDERDLKMIIRYEAHLHRLWVSTLHELEALQARRRGERSPLARLDITTTPSGP